MARGTNGHDLEKLSHLILAGQAMQGRVDCFPLRCCRAALQYLRPSGDTQLLQKCTLADRTMVNRPRCRLGQSLKINMRGQIRLARMGQWIDVFMGPHGLQSITRRAMFMTIIDDQAGTAMFKQMLAQF